MTGQDLVVVIPTWRRVGVLQDLIGDIGRQEIIPNAIVVVDGDPDSNRVMEMLRSLQMSSEVPTYLVRSPRANLPFQRYLGWHVARRLEASVVGYFDDDLRLEGNLVMGSLLRPFSMERSEWRPVIGVTAEIQMQGRTDRVQGSPGAQSSTTLREGGYKPVRNPDQPRGLSPGGHRLPLPNRSEGELSAVRWFRGGVILVRASILDENSFSKDLMASYERRLGKGEDTLLGLRVSSRGRILQLHTKHIHHPGTGVPRAYPSEAFRRGRATAYSRRLINDNIRYPARPRLSDRLGLLRSYLGSPIVQLARGLRAADASQLRFAAGFTLGALQAMVIPPRSHRLAPQIEWQREARESAGQCVRVAPHSDQSSRLAAVLPQPTRPLKPGSQGPQL